MKKSHHQIELDLARVIGAVSVLLFHYTFRGYAASNYSVVDFPVLGEVFKYGYLAIYIFFMISGYTIVNSLRNKDALGFVYSRFMRLYPQYWIAVCLTVIVTVILGGDRFTVELKQFAVNLTMFNGFFGIHSIDGAYWFMHVMLKFYLLALLIILINGAKYYQVFAGLWLALSAVTYFFDIPKIGYFLIPEIAPFFVAGVIFYSAKEKGWDKFKVIMISFALAYSIHIVLSDTIKFTQKYNTDISNAMVALFVLMIYGFMLFISLRRKPAALPKQFILLGACTYPLYLIHQNIGYMLFNFLHGHINKYLSLVIIMLVVSALSFLIYSYLGPFVVKFLRKTIFRSRK